MTRPTLTTDSTAPGPCLFALALAAGLAMSVPVAQAQRAAAPSGQTQTQAPALLLETAGKWQAFSAQQERVKICYVVGKVETRSPANLKDVEGMLFVSSRPAQGVRNEISLIMNFDLKEDVEHQAVVGEDRYALVAKKKTMWLKNPAEEPRMLDSLRKGATLEIRGTSQRGNPTNDKYSLAGFSQVSKRAEDACK